MNRLKELIASLDAWSLDHRWTRVGRRAISGFMAHEALQYAGSMAYFSVLSLFQLLVLGVVVFSLFFGQSEARQVIVDQVAAGSPLDPETIGGIIDAVIEGRGGVTIIGALFLAWSALGVFSSISGGIGRAFEATKPRGFIGEKVLGLVLMGITGLLAAASLVIGIVTGILQEAAGGVIRTVPGGELAISLIGLVVPFLLIFVAFLTAHSSVTAAKRRVLPSIRPRDGSLLPSPCQKASVGPARPLTLRTATATSGAKHSSSTAPVSA